MKASRNYIRGDHGRGLYSRVESMSGESRSEVVVIVRGRSRGMQKDESIEGYRVVCRKRIYQLVPNTSRTKE